MKIIELLENYQSVENLKTISYYFHVLLLQEP